MRVPARGEAFTNNPLRVLIVEDSENDAQLALHELRRGGYDPQFLRVETAEEMSSALAQKGWDVIIADYNLPHFSAPAALALLKKTGLDLPFIVVSGSIGETHAVEAMKSGAHDYVMKDRLLRLAPAVARELREAQLRREHALAEEAISHLASFPEKSPSPIVEIEIPDKVRYVNPAGVEAFPDLRTRSQDHPVVAELPRVLEELASGCKSVCTRELTCCGKCYLATYNRPLDAPIIRCYLKDITQRKQAEKQIVRRDRALRVLSECNKALVRDPEESALLNDICRIVVQMGGYQSAWIGFPEDNEKKTVRVATSVGFGKTELEAGQVSWAEDESGRGPTGTAIRTRSTCVVQDATAEPNSAARRDGWSKYRHAGAIALPLLHGDRSLGALTIYSATPNAFTSEEVRLLKETADDIAYGIQALRTRADRDRHAQALRESEQKYRILVENIQLGITLISSGYKVITANDALGKLRGIPARDCVGGLCFNIFENRDAVCPYCPGTTAMRKGMPTETEAYATRTDGSRLPVRLQAFPVLGPDGAPHGFIEVVEDITRQKNAEEQLRRSASRLRRMMEGTVKAMACAIEARDPYTAGHEKRVAQLACAIAAQMGMSEDEIEGIRIAGYLHDIGKIAIPAEILAKPGKITDNEFSIIKTHSQFGYDILKVIDFPWPVALVALQHHERLNGSGYPRGISGEKTIPQARVIAVADVVEAMSSHRPYRPALGTEAAMAEVTGKKGILYDPRAVDACNAVFSEKHFRFE